MAAHSAWKVATFVALVSAAVGSVRIAKPTSEPTEATDSQAGSPEEPDDEPAPRTVVPLMHLRDVLAELSGRLSVAGTARSACVAFDDLAHSGDPRAAGVIAGGIRARVEIRSRRCGVAALATLGGPSALVELTRFVDDADGAIRGAACSALARSGVPEALAIVRAAAALDDPGQRYAALVALGNAHMSDAAPSIARALDTAMGSSQRQQLLEALGNAGDPATVAIVVPLTIDPNPVIRETAYAALGHLDGDEAVTALIRIMRTAPTRDASVAARALAASQQPVARAALIRAISEPGIVAEHAANALVEIEGADVDAVMAAILTSENPLVLAAGIERVVARHDADAIPRLVELVDHGNGTVADAALAALESFDDRRAQIALEAIATRPGRSRQDALGRLVAMPDSHDRAIEIASVIAGDEGGESVRYALELIAADPTPVARARLQALARLDPEIASEAASQLRREGVEESLPLLQELDREAHRDPAR